MILLRRALLGLLAVTLGCAELKDGLTFAAALHAEFRVPAKVVVRNGTHLLVTFENSPASVQADSARRADFAYDVAVFVKKRYPRAAELEYVTVTFASVWSAGPAAFTIMSAPYRWEMAELP